jgi:uncharacterized protein (DUF2147 family)
MIKKVNICVILALLSLFAMTALAQTAPAAPAAPALTPAQRAIVGTWDEQNGGGVAELFIKDGVVYGKIVHTSPKLDNNGVCSKCDGSRKNQPYVGMVIMYGFKQEGTTDVWGSGSIVDVYNAGRVVSGKITVEKGGAQLTVRGYIGSPILGESHTWKRIK